MSPKAASAVRKFLGIPPSNDDSERILRGESIASSTTATPYIEQDPTVDGYLRDLWPSKEEAGHYLRSLLPFLDWIGRYNRIWFTGDFVAGCTVGVVLVPQAMAYAKLANLPVEYGLYSSFVGVLFYFAFATSKDITIGPVAVMSLLTGHIINDVQKEHPDISGPAIGSALAVLSGAFVFALGLFRLGFIIDYIPLTSIGAFMTGSALNIAVGQFPGMMGESGFDTKAETYHVFINSLKHLGSTNLNAAIGLPALFLLYFMRWACNTMAARRPHQAKAWFFIGTLRTVFTILLFVLISWLVNRHHRDAPKFTLLGTVPRGFKHMGVPKIDTALVSAIGHNLPGAIIVLLIEHIAISKSFGRVNNYTISPSQELIAIGFTNLIGSFFGAYPATGSFSRTAIKSKAGVRTPLAGVITAAIVVLALYALTPMFFYIPNAALSAVIIHAVLDLITPPKSLWHWWRVSPPEVIIFFAGVIGSVFGSVEIGIYTTICSTAGLLLFRLAKAHGDFLGRIRVTDSGVDGVTSPFLPYHDEPMAYRTRSVFVPRDHADGSNPIVPVQQPTPGIFIYRVRESVLYPNVQHVTDKLVEVILRETKRTNPTTYERLGDRPWNLPGPRYMDPNAHTSDPRPTLKALILDVSSVDHIDVTGVQVLQDVRAQLDRHASPDRVEWHFAGVNRPWVKRALAAGGFGTTVLPETGASAAPIFSIAHVEDASGSGNGDDDGDTLRGRSRERSMEEGDGDGEERRKERRGRQEQDGAAAAGAGDSSSSSGVEAVTRAMAKLPILSLDRQAFHLDVESALLSVESRLAFTAKL